MSSPTCTFDKVVITWNNQDEMHFLEQNVCLCRCARIFKSLLTLLDSLGSQQSSEDKNFFSFSIKHLLRNHIFRVNGSDLGSGCFKHQLATG